MVLFSRCLGNRFGPGHDFDAIPGTKPSLQGVGGSDRRNKRKFSLV
jgi:hypothetical protein